MPNNPITEQLKTQVQQYVDAHRDELIDISQTLHANPEVAFEEHKSMALLADTAEQHGFAVERGVVDLETAFIATSNGQSDGPIIAFIAEYDALPGLGHACGHNIIGTAATGAALAVHSLREQIPGVIKLIGTPAEERGGGKVMMAEWGVFDDVDAAMMIHPGSRAMTVRGSLASNKLEFEFFGKASHAAAAPDAGINALDACIQTFNNINALRQHLSPDVRVHGIITHGGDAPNIVPDYAACAFSVRAATSAPSFEVVEKVIRCAEAGALAAGTTVKCTHQTHYANRIPNPTMARIFGENFEALGIPVFAPRSGERMGSSDMGTVSQLVPSIHPYVPIVDPGVGGHTPEFAAAAASERGNQALLDSAKALAMTAVELFTQPGVMAQVRDDFAATVDPNATWRSKRFFT